MKAKTLLVAGAFLLLLGTLITTLVLLWSVYIGDNGDGIHVSVKVLFVAGLAIDLAGVLLGAFGLFSLAKEHEEI